MATKMVKFGEHSLLSDQCHVMGILNITQDSFYDGGRYTTVNQVLARARVMVEQGAAIIDVGGESTRPNARPVSEQEELDRVLPVIEVIRRELNIILSVDTSNARLIKEAAALGVHMVNDVRALQQPGSLQAAKEAGIMVCLMHMQGQPNTMQLDPHYQNLLADIQSFLRQRMRACLDIGIEKEKILIDPGFGFGKTPEHNFQLLNELEQFHQIGCKILVGMSRKSMIEAVIHKSVEHRLHASVALATIAAMKEAFIVRVHDVEATVDAISMVNAMRKESLN